MLLTRPNGTETEAVAGADDTIILPDDNMPIAKLPADTPLPANAKIKQARQHKHYLNWFLYQELQ